MTALQNMKGNTGGLVATFEVTNVYIKQEQICTFEARQIWKVPCIFLQYLTF